MVSVLLILGVVIALVVVVVSVTTIVLVCNFNKGKFVKCTNCGSSLESNSKFCENCGHILQ